MRLADAGGTGGAGAGDPLGSGADAAAGDGSAAAVPASARAKRTAGCATPPGPATPPLIRSGGVGGWLRARAGLVVARAESALAGSCPEMPDPVVAGATDESLGPFPTGSKIDSPAPAGAVIISTGRTPAVPKAGREPASGEADPLAVRHCAGRPEAAAGAGCEPGGDVVGRASRGPRAEPACPDRRSCCAAG